MTDLRKAALEALEALMENHQWHQDYDDHGGYPASILCLLNSTAIEKLRAIERAHKIGT